MPRTLKDWITCAAVAREWDIDWSSVPAVAAAGGVRVRQLPGMTPRYNAADVARVKAEAERPAAAEGRVA